MFRTPKISLLVLWLLASTPIHLSAQTEESHGQFAELLRSENQGISDDAVAEIVDIRKRIGSGLRLEVSEMFNKPEKSVAKDLSKLVASKSVSEEIFGGVLDKVGVEPHGDDKSQAKIVSMRTIARKLDELAADLEDLNMFQDADLIRAQALKIRGKARLAVGASNIQLR